MKDNFNNQFATQRLLQEQEGPFYVVYNKGYGKGKGVAIDFKPFPSFDAAQAFADERNDSVSGVAQPGQAYYYVVGSDHEDFEWVSQAAHDKAQSNREMGEDIEENSVTGAGANFVPGTGEQYATPKAFKKTQEQKDVEPKLAAGKAKVYAKNKWGWKEAPSVPNRPSKGGFIYKQLFEMKVSDLELDYPEFAGVVEYVADYLGLDLRAVQNADIKNANDDYFEIVNIPGEEGKTVFVEIARVGKVLHLNITTSDPTYSNVSKTTMQLQENYSRFKKETKTRTNEQQLHAAMRLAEKKIHEANRILEYTSQLRGELNETRVNKNTQKLMEKITRGIAEAYGKMKKLK